MDLTPFNRGGRKPGKRRHGKPIKTPSASDNCGNNGFGLDDIYGDDSPDRNRRTSPPPHNQNDSSDNSRFSTDCQVGDDRNERADKGHQKKEQKKQRQMDKRQRQKDTLAEMQKQNHIERDCILIDDDDEGGTAAASSFDGVRTDGVNNAKSKEYVKNLKQKFGDNGDDVEELADRAKQRGRKNFRGNHHEKKSTMAKSLSPAMKGNQRMLKSGRVSHQQYGKTGCVLPSHSGDPLDVAQAEQQTNRARSSTASAFRDRLGKGKSSNEKVVEHVMHSPEYMKKRSATQTVGQKMNSHLPKDGGDMTSNRRKRNDKCGGAAQQRMNQPLDSSVSAERGKVSSGEKRKSAHRSERREDRPSSKKQNSREGSEHDAIDVDDQHQSIWPAGTSSGKGGNNNVNDEDVDIIGAVEACGQPFSAEVFEQNSTPKSDTGRITKENNPIENYWDNEEMKEKMQGTSNLGLQRNLGGNGSKSKKTSGKKKVTDFSAHLKNTKRSDDIVEGSSPNSKGGLRNMERNSSVSNVGRWIPKKDGRCYGKDSKLESARTRTQSNTLYDQSMKQGVAFEDEDNSKGGTWLSPIMKTKNQKVKKAKTKTHHPKKSFSPSITKYATKRRTRSSSTPKGGKDEVITIDSSSDEDEMSIDASNDASESIAERLPRRKRSPGDRACIDAVRIAVGKKVFKSRCELSFQFGTTDPYIHFSFFDKNKRSEHSVHLKNEELKEVKYFIADENEDNAVTDDNDNSMTMIAFRITPTEKNKFTKYSSAYHQEDTEDAEKNERRYISVEFRDTDDFRALLEQMRENQTLEVWCSEDSKIPSYDLEKYTKALLDDSRKERNERLSIARRTRSGGSNKKKKGSENNLLLVYPFNVDESAMTEAASDLKELGGDSMGVEDLEIQNQSDGGNASDDKGKSSRTHYVTIREDDKDRLCPGQFLNDTLVDFWMRWINRGESQQTNSSVHFFTSHFMTTLKDDGPESVSSWTAKKNINVFEKKLIFIPVNADLHWSLCVVVNPGLIANSYDNDISSREEHSSILFLDSLRMHNKNTYARHIRDWLNCEWKRLGKGKVGDRSAPFTKEGMTLTSPKIPYQENGCDCGVFVCRYAYNLFMMRHQKFTWKDICGSFNSLITRGPAFQFDMFDIARIREEIGTLIDNLSKLYLRMKEQERQEKANKKAKRREIKSPKGGKPDVSEDATNAASKKEDTRSETTTAASNEDDGTPEGNTTDAAVEKDEGGDVAISSSEGKENISQGVGSQNSVLEVAAPEKLGGKVQSNHDGDIVSPLL